jgi:hypothetical protein
MRVIDQVHHHTPAGTLDPDDADRGFVSAAVIE